jgi:hypothetical protein
LCNGKLLITPDKDWNLFTEAIVRAIHIKKTTPAEYYEHFYWANITRRAAEFIMTEDK